MSGSPVPHKSSSNFLPGPPHKWVSYPFPSCLPVLNTVPLRTPLLSHPHPFTPVPQLRPFSSPGMFFSPLACLSFNAHLKTPTSFKKPSQNTIAKSRKSSLPQLNPWISLCPLCYPSGAVESTWGFEVPLRSTIVHQLCVLP